MSEESWLVLTGSVEPSPRFGWRVPRTRRSRSEGTWPVPSRAVSSILSHLFRLLIARVGLLLVGGDRKDAEILALRHPILVLRRQIDRPSFTPASTSTCSGSPSASRVLPSTNEPPPTRRDPRGLIDAPSILEAGQARLAPRIPIKNWPETARNARKRRRGDRTNGSTLHSSGVSRRGFSRPRPRPRVLRAHRRRSRLMRRLHGPVAPWRPGRPHRCLRRGRMADPPRDRPRLGQPRSRRLHPLRLHGAVSSPIPVSKFEALQEQIDIFEMITGVAPPRLTDIAA